MRKKKMIKWGWDEAEDAPKCCKYFNCLHYNLEVPKKDIRNI
jgi:hypothetical protein